MNLAQLQSALFSLVTRDGTTRLDAAKIVGGGAIAPNDRVGIYGEMYVLRTQDSIREDFPKTSALLGERFEATVLQYVQQHGSTHYSLSMLGERFPAFLREHGQALLSDLAQLEWLHAWAFVAVDSDVLSASALAGIDPQKFAAGRLRFIDAWALQWLDHDVRALWRDGKSEAPAVRKAFLVWRKGHEVFHVVVEDDEAKAIEVLRQGGTIEAACEAFEAREDPAGAAFTAIGSWLTEGMVEGVRL